MTGQLYNLLCDPYRLFQAWLKVARKRGATGVDSESVGDFERNAAKNIQRISVQLAQGQYEPSPLRTALIPKEQKGRFRRLGIPTVRDRIVFQAINAILQELWSEHFSPLSCAYKSGTGVAQAIETVADLLRRENFWFVKGDIRGCFDSLDWGILSQRLKEWLPDEALRALINKAVRVPVVHEGRINARGKGVPQGSPISPILANLYLYPFDYELLSHRIPVIRYADDWLVLVKNEREAAEAFHVAQAVLSTLLIQINEEKSGIGDLNRENILFLGHTINAHNIDAGPNGWKRFADALRELKSARSKSEVIAARGKLSNLRSFYRGAGDIDGTGRRP